MSSVASLNSPSSNHSFSFTQLMNSNFTDFFAATTDENTTTTTKSSSSVENNWGLFDSRTSSSASEMQQQQPKFKSHAPPSLPPVSPSSYLASPLAFSPSVFLLDSPLIFPNSNNFPSPTVGALVANKQSGGGDDSSAAAGFSFQTQAAARNSTTVLGSTDDASMKRRREQVQQQQHQDSWNSSSSIDQPQQQTMEQQPRQPQPQQHHQQQQQAPSYQFIRSNNRSDDGYNWRKYGQKNVKGSENPRSYYKCSYPNCPTKKKVERSVEGHITEIVYKGSHNHPKPQPRRPSSYNTSNNHHESNHVVHHDSFQQQQQQQQQAGGGGGGGGCGGGGYIQPSSSTTTLTPETSSVSMVDEDEFDQTTTSSMTATTRPAGRDDEVNEPESKRPCSSNKLESTMTTVESEVMSAYGSKAVREPRVVVQTMSEIDILDDGFRWRKYGQKVVKGNPNPRSYYKCTTIGCPVRKHIERASHDLRAVITTYEGKHSHDLPAARGSSYTTTNRPPTAPAPAPAPASGGNSNVFVPVAASTERPATLQWVQNPNPNPNSNPGYGYGYGYGNNNYNNNGGNNGVMMYHQRAKEEQLDHHTSSFLDF